MKRSKNLIYIVIIFFITALLLGKLFLFDRYEGHDTIFHVSNIINLSKTISLDNLFGSNILQYSINKFGYGIYLFYPKLPHLFAGYVYLLTKDVYLSMKLVYFITTFLSGIFTYFLSKKIFKDNKVALLSSVIYLTVPYHLCEIYIRDAFAENFMFMVLPMIFLGLYNLKEDNYRNFYILFTLGYLIGMHSHLASMVFYTIFVGIFILYYHREYFKWDRFKALLISTLIVSGITLPFLVSIIEHKLLNLYIVFTDIFTDLLLVQFSSLKIENLFKPIPIYNDVYTFFSGVTIILFIISIIIFVFKKKEKYKKDKKIFLFIIIWLVTIICSKVFWASVPELLLSIQFPWRLLVMLSLFISLYVSSGLLEIKRYKSLTRFLTLFLIVFITYEGVNNIFYYKDSEVLVDDAINSTISMGFQYEYLPYSDLDGEYYFKYGKHYFEVREYEIISDSDMEVNIIKDNFPDLEFEVINLEEMTEIELPRIYYLGYELVDEEGNEINLYNKENGFLSAKINKNGKYKLTYEKTIWYKVACLVRLLVILGIISFGGVKLVRWKRKK